MQLWHPLHLIPSGLTDWLVLGLLVALILGLASKTNHPSLITKQAPCGIVSLELAGNEEKASAIHYCLLGEGGAQRCFKQPVLG